MWTHAQRFVMMTSTLHVSYPAFDGGIKYSINRHHHHYHHDHQHHSFITGGEKE